MKAQREKTRREAVTLLSELTRLNNVFLDGNNK